MRHLLLAILCLAFDQAAASDHAGKSRELVHAYPPTGPVEVAGTAVAGKVLRTMQRHAMPALRLEHRAADSFSELLARERQRRSAG